MNIVELMEGLKGESTDVQIDILAEAMVRYPHLADQIRHGLKGTQQSWTIPSLSKEGVVVARDRGGRQTFIKPGADGQYLILGQDERLHPISEHYALAMGFLGLPIAQGR